MSFYLTGEGDARHCQEGEGDQDGAEHVHRGAGDVAEGEGAPQERQGRRPRKGRYSIDIEFVSESA